MAEYSGKLITIFTVINQAPIRGDATIFRPARMTVLQLEFCCGKADTGNLDCQKIILTVNYVPLFGSFFFSEFRQKLPISGTFKK
jgi:hypothetical protein